MAVKSVQLNNLQQMPSFKQDVKSYRDAEGTITTENNIKPLPPKGHLVDDNFGNAAKYFFKDIGYDLKSVKDGYKGTANDHQLGRLNDVGLVLGGTALATYLASRTTNPKARIMEYIGLATFLTSMALYPKIAINAPARVLHGYDIDKQYIDDQGRKKSVQQDSNYVPYDMYMSGNKGEDLDAIGDRMGIPRDIKNRHDVVREQMRKVATQNNTLWMLTAGFATPLMTALLCNVIENKIVAPSLEKSRNAKYNEMIHSTLNQTKLMSEDISGLENGLSRQVNKFLSKRKDGILPKEDFEDLVSMLTKNTDSILADGIRRDVEQMVYSDRFKVSSEIIDGILENASKSIKGRNVETVLQILPNKAELENIIKEVLESADLTKEQLLTSKNIEDVNEKLANLIDSKYEKLTGSTMPKEFADARKLDFITGIKWEKVSVVNEDKINKLVDFAKVLGDFKEKQAALDKCKNFKFEYAPETILARYYTKFQDALMKGLKISHKDYAKIRDDKEFARKLLDEKLEALSKNEEEYTKLFEKLGGVMADMEKALHGSKEDQSQILDLINGIENNYNNTARRLEKAGLGKETIDRLVKEDVSTLSNDIMTTKELREILDGIKENDFGGDMVQQAKGKGSSKNLEISRLISRSQGQANSFFRIFHTMELYKRAANPENMMYFTSLKDEAFVKELLNIGKNTLLGASSPDYVMKFDMVNNPMGYKDMVNSVWTIEEQAEGLSTKNKGYVTESGKKALTNGEKTGKSGLLERFQYYISRAKNLLTNNRTDFTKPYHNFWDEITNAYTKSAQTNEAMFNLVGQSPVDMIQKGAARKRGDRKWLAIIGTITGAVFGVTLLTQFAFGKISNRHNLQKQVNNETDK